LGKWRRREEIIGKEVIDGEAKKIGVTKDIAWSEEGTLAILIESMDEQDFFLEFDDVERIGDVIFIKPKTSLQSIPTKTCPMCKQKNPLEAMFCAKCGHPLESKDVKNERKGGETRPGSHIVAK
jgi:sporulation protein YlmC with PRC-barrel domain